MKLSVCFPLLWPCLVLGMGIRQVSNDRPVLEAINGKKARSPQLTPDPEITLTYDNNGETYATASLVMNQPAVVLGDVEGISSVHCDGAGIHITFDSPGTFNYGRSWAEHSSVILITNHHGNCDANGEPGFYVTSNIEQNEVTRVLTASVDKKKLVDVASSIQASFSGHQLDQQANMSFSNPSIWDISYMNAAGQVFSDNPSLIGLTEQGYFYTSLSYSGYLDYELGSATGPRSLYLDVALTSNHGLPLVLNATMPYKGRASVQVGYLEAGAWGIPGILDVRPALTYEAGAEVDAPAAMVAQTNLTTVLSDGRARIDLVTPDQTASSGMWDGNYGSGVTIEPSGPVRVAPFLSLTAAFAVNVTGLGEHFYQAIRGSSRSAYDFQLVGGGAGDVCSRSSYGYTIEAYNLDGWHRTLLDRQDPYTNGCL
ncbi:hypothetical protein PFICI_10125 [Pestalotiopsis fici W106-1]|uniref:DUF7029 domain-containing protein n=1 Tax=Pestalotiopsis fici (strain W106-1 / CGMCC3.15140) TaxID=1229662 RepID=W3WW12_PESFW|nr:uncharacterized protein PFICI_10125 [Pestalotiopsis fici W106-1]ETS78063.1 hypothetical protein PFICI_10125 [Pestalotiopsis fici W106-1]